MSEFVHKSVLLEETVDSLNIRPDGVYVDCTLGGGGHACHVAKKLTTGRLIGIDQDGDAIKAASARLAEFDPVTPDLSGENGSSMPDINDSKVVIVRDNYVNIASVLRMLDIEKVSGIYIDLGVSSYQLDTAERGFSYQQEAPLDMRMDDRNPLTAADIVNTYSQQELARIIRDYSEDKFAQNIAKHICIEREKAPIRTTTELAEIVKQAIPMKMRLTGGHPAKRTFQAIRIELNGELTVLKNSIDTMIDHLEPGGRLSIITFHSLEDRIVKEAFRKAENPCTCPPNFPVCVCGAVSKGRVITRKPILPGEKELEENRRSESAKLRVFEKV